MKIAIVSKGRSHLLSLAIELEKLKNDVYFYTSLPKKRCEQFGGNAKWIKSCFILLFPIYILRFFSQSSKCISFISKYVSYISDYIFSCYSAVILKPCDILIINSVLPNPVVKKAQKKYNAKIICDCGTKHVYSQILASDNSAPESLMKDRELQNYDISDIIVVASLHAKESFIINGISESKIFINPYGFDSAEFRPTIKNEKSMKYDVIITGMWRHIKGCDLLATACCDILKIKLLHVGGIYSDCPVPKSELFTHVDSVSQKKLREYYSQAKIFALPSRSDGFGLVLLQAVGCGLPIVFSKNTGGPDIKRIMGEDSPYLFEMESINLDSLVQCIENALLLDSKSPFGVDRNYMNDKVEELSWSGYGKRYEMILRSII